MEQGAAGVAEVITHFCSIVPAHDTRRSLPREWGSLSSGLHGHILFFFSDSFYTSDEFRKDISLPDA